jgi:hypothetical protein
MPRSLWERERLRYSVQSAPLPGPCTSKGRPGAVALAWVALKGKYVRKKKKKKTSKTNDHENSIPGYSEGKARQYEVSEQKPHCTV